MRLFLVRHGQTEKNRLGMMMGHYDDELNETGIEQVKQTKELAMKIDYDAIIASPLKRASQTADIINYKKLDVIYDERLLERDMGYLTNASVHSAVDRGDFWNLNPAGDYRDAEPMRDMYKRIGEFYEDIKQRYKNKTVLVVTHDGVVRTLYGYLYGVPESGELLEGRIKNGEVREIVV